MRDKAVFMNRFPPVLSKSICVVLPVTDPPVRVVDRPHPRQPDNHRLPRALPDLAHAHPAVVVVHPRPVVQQSPRPGIDGRLARLVARLLEERDQRGPACPSCRFILSRGDGGNVHYRWLRFAREAPAVAARLASLDDDVPGYHLDVLVAEGAEHGEAGVVRQREFGGGLVLPDEGADVGHGAYV